MEEVRPSKVMRFSPEMTTAIIVPFRDEHVEQQRAAQLAQFLPYMQSFLPQAHVFVIEQSRDGKLFNRGKLLNIGFKIATANTEFKVFAFHDVDLIPESSSLKRFYTESPPAGTAIHIAACWKRYQGEQYFGGAVAFNREDYQKINGFPNEYWGWGGEDDELRRRTLKCGVQISKVENGVMRDLENLNLQDKLDYLKAKKLKNMQKWELKEAHESTWDTDGLADLSFKVLSESHGPNWSRYLVDLESTAMEPVRKAPAKLRFSPKLPTAPKGSSDKIWDRIDLMYNSVLKDMFVSHQVVFPDGTRDKFHSGISPREGFHLYDVVRQNKFSKTMEVGCAFGTSALYICQAMHDWQKDSCASGLASEVIPQHVSIDPNQSTQWKSVGVLNVERAGLKQYHTLIEDVSYLALPRILSDIRRDPNPKYFDLIFVDGMHLFDYTILDVFYTMHLLKLGGVLVLDDIKHEGVYAAYRFIVSNLEGCLKLCHPSPCERTAATFVKTAQDSRPWDFHRKF